MIAIAEHMKDDAFEVRLWFRLSPAWACVLTHISPLVVRARAARVQNFDTNTDGKLTFEQFQAWSRGTPEVMHMLESVIGSDGSALLDSRASAGAEGAK